MTALVLGQGVFFGRDVLPAHSLGGGHGTVYACAYGDLG